jgi:hypothetical protein
MNIAKFFAAAALAAAPVGVASAQSATPTDSGSQHRDGWIAGTGAAAGAGLFLAFAHSGRHSAGDAAPVGFRASAGSNGTGQAPVGLTPPPTGGSSPTPAPGDSTPSHGTVTPPDTTPAPPPKDTPLGPTNFAPPQSPKYDGPFLPHSNSNPPNNGPTFVAESSTVPEPGTLALTATGIIGLVPLIRRRRR